MDSLKLISDTLSSELSTHAALWLHKLQSAKRPREDQCERTHVYIGFDHTKLI